MAVLNLGNVEFGRINDNQISASANSKDHLMEVSKLLQIDVKALIKALTIKKTIVAKDVIETQLDIDAAYQSRDTLAKFIYGSMFSWIV